MNLTGLIWSLSAAPQKSDLNLLSITLKEGFNLKVDLSLYLVIVSVLIGIIILLYKLYIGSSFGVRSFEIDEAEIGLGSHKIKLKPNLIDKQIAYKIWVELSTRKLGLPIDLEKDIIAEVYDSWYAFFGVTRELIKEMPVNNFRRRDTEKIIRLSIDILNHGVRPHLTAWQAAYRRWYERAIEDEKYADLTPQEVQKKFPHYDVLTENMRSVNGALVEYRNILYRLIAND